MPRCWRRSAPKRRPRSMRSRRRRSSSSWPPATLTTWCRRAIPSGSRSRVLGGTTMHLLKMPSAKDVFEYRRGFARVLDLPFNRQELTINIARPATSTRSSSTPPKGTRATCRSSIRRSRSKPPSTRSTPPSRRTGTQISSRGVAGTIPPSGTSSTGRCGARNCAIPACARMRQMVAGATTARKTNSMPRRPPKPVCSSGALSICARR